MSSHLTNRLLLPLKILAPMALITWLCHRTWRDHPEAYRQLFQHQEHPLRLVACFALILLAACLCFVRWHLLMRMLEIPVRLRDTMRLGFLGALLSFVGPGQVGGDLFKAFFIAREQPGRRTEAIATIVVDRLWGLYSLLLLAAGATFFIQTDVQSTALTTITHATRWSCLVGTLVVIVLMLPGVADGPIARRLSHLPRIGKTFHRLFDAVYRYRNDKLGMFLVATISVVVHLLEVVAVYLASTGIYAQSPELKDHFVIVPIACVAGCLPLTPGGIGSYELAMSFLYDLMSDPQSQGRGIVIALTYRLATILVAAVGLGFYWTHQREVASVMRQAQHADRGSLSEAMPTKP